MQVSAMALFGSRARGDHSQDSDMDILMVTSELRPKHVSASHMSFSFYPVKYLEKKAREGDLFVCHLIKEAKVFFDEKDIFEKIRKKFRLRDSYDAEVTKASALGWFIVRHGKSFENINTANRRIAWCVRTILIARTAEARKPIFAAKALAKFAKSNTVIDLIECKTSEILKKKILNTFTDFLNKWGNGDIAASDKSPFEYFQHFQKTGNSVALQTYRHGWAMSEDTYT